MKGFEQLNQKQQEVIFNSLMKVALVYHATNTKKKSVDKKEHAKLIINSFNIECKRNQVTTMERVEMLPLITSSATLTGVF